MAIKFDKLFVLMKSRGMFPAALLKNRVVGKATFEKIKGNAAGGVDTRTINSVCAFLSCQPGDIMEWIPDEKPEDPAAAE